MSQMMTIICRVVRLSFFSDEAYLVPPTFNWMISPIPGVKLLPFVSIMAGPTAVVRKVLFRYSCCCHES